MTTVRRTEVARWIMGLSEMDFGKAVEVLRQGFNHGACPDQWEDCNAARAIVAELGAIDRESLARHVREAWVRWAQQQPTPKPSWLVPYDSLSEDDKEADRQIGEHIYILTKMYCDVTHALKCDEIIAAYESGGYAAAGKVAVRLAKGF